MALFDRDFKLTIGEEPTVDGKIETRNSRVISTRVDRSSFNQERPTLRVAFKITKNIYKETLNTAEVTIYNLSTEHRALLQEKNTPCLLEAGYVGTSSQIFEGQLNIANHTKDGTDWITKFHSVDGMQAVQESRVNESLGPGTTVAQAVNSLAKSLGVGVGNSIQQLSKSLPRPGMGTFQKGISMSGRAYDVLGSLMASCGLDMSIQDGALQVLPPDEANGDQVIVLDQEHGMIGNAEEGEDKQKKPTVLVKSLLQPKMRPGSTIYLNSRNANGFYRIENVIHSGDNWGQDWNSDLILGQITPPTGGAISQLQKLEPLQ